LTFKKHLLLYNHNQEKDLIPMKSTLFARILNDRYDHLLSTDVIDYSYMPMMYDNPSQAKIDILKACTGNATAAKRFRRHLRLERIANNLDSNIFWLDNKETTALKIIKDLLDWTKPSNMPAATCAGGRHVFGPML
jgi:hypothetical protein